MPSGSVARFYLRRVRRVLHGVPRLLSFLLASALHAIGHALVALVAGAVALSLTERFVAGSAAVASSSPPGSEILVRQIALFFCR